MTEKVSIEVMLKKVTRARHSKEGFQGKTQRTKTKKNSKLQLKWLFS